jgi:hypothetical protein
MYAAVPRITPLAVIAGEVRVGEFEESGIAGSGGLGQAEIQHLYCTVRPHLDICGLQVAVDDSALVRRVQCLADLSGDR